jgi:hypothetical protein
MVILFINFGIFTTSRCSCFCNSVVIYHYPNFIVNTSKEARYLI